MPKIDEYKASLSSQLLAKRGTLLQAREAVKQVEREALRIEGALMRIDEILAIQALDKQELAKEPGDDTPRQPGADTPLDPDESGQVRGDER